MKDNIIYPEAFQFDVDVPGSLRSLADEFAAGKVKEIAITVLEGDEGNGIIICDQERADVLIAAVIEHMNDWLDSQKTTTH
ncbi:MAG: hypothetical protein QM310_00235 [Pseudomonadota bacterium]|jgi:hypothetical protein|nr:hypothetical protein [Deltaproteobacteria bacterium]MDI9541298.1 hypothetical protein [Pseudomonadota bacterium]